MKERILTENQKNFLEALFGEAQGDVRAAMRVAGYAESVKPYQVVSSLKTEIKELGDLILAMNVPKATMEMIGLLTDPTQVGALNKIKVIQEILNRTGVADKTPAGDVNLKVPQGGLFIMPAKETKEEV
jgi:hypothetical protein